MKFYRGLYYRGSFWGIVKMHRGWRIGIGIGFIELGTGMSGLHWPRRDAVSVRETFDKITFKEVK